MKKLEIFKIDNYRYFLQDKDNNKYNLRMKFLDIMKNPIINDVIYINEELIKEGGFYIFGPLGSKYGRKIESEIDKDILILERNKQKIFLQRYYA